MLSISLKLIMYTFSYHDFYSAFRFSTSWTLPVSAVSSATSTANSGARCPTNFQSSCRQGDEVPDGDNFPLHNRILQQHMNPLKRHVTMPPKSSNKQAQSLR
ncbi:hypothetical protein ZEAMMB73_Zm00001d029588 [Zea mays]|uniref:Uncharacterized protein n=1 Tax=Zea mays TaxID=4577 RepID=A0A1D6K647_MAIZE|nr:hypothetical protein ZEAMMB73_Zm00001d029588 [Zea mays]